MGEPTDNQPDETPLNPALKSRTETVYDTRNVTPPPIATTSAREDEGEGWPVIWLVVAVIGAILAVYFIL